MTDQITFDEGVELAPIKRAERPYTSKYGFEKMEADKHSFFIAGAKDSPEVAAVRASATQATKRLPGVKFPTRYIEATGKGKTAKPGGVRVYCVSDKPDAATE